MDCARRRRPCKHMYRLAAELGLYDLGILKSDASKIKMMNSEKNALEDRFTAIVDGYPEDVQRDLQEALYHWHNGSAYVSTRSLSAAPVSDGLFQIVNDPALVLSKHTQKETVEALVAADFEFPTDLKTTKKARYEWCLQHPDEPCRIVYPDAVVVKVTDAFEPVALRVYKHINKIIWQREEMYWYGN